MAQKTVEALGLEIEASSYRANRDHIGYAEKTPAGNTVLAVFRENTGKVAHVVLSPNEVERLTALLNSDS